MKDLINRTITALGISYITVHDIRDMLLAEGLSEYDAWLTYKAAKLIVESQHA